MTEHTLIDGASSKTAANEQDGLLLWVESQGFHSLVTTDGGIEQILTHGVTRQDDLVCREKALHALVGHTDFRCLCRKRLIGQSGIAILLLDKRRNAQAVGSPKSSAAGITTHADSHVWTELTQHLLG